MKERLLEWLRCPVCRTRVVLEAFARAGGEVEEGRLTCETCGRDYPVIGGIPRMLPDALAPAVVSQHREFFTRHERAMAGFLRRCAPTPGDRWWRAERKTHKSYSYQWRKFKEMFPHWEEVFRFSIEPIGRDFFPGKIGLDAGCGYGRSIYYAASYGAEMIGLDLSEAIEAARENTRHLPNVHLVQGDIFSPPIEAGALDFVYSIGVLMILPDPRCGFVSLSRLLKPGAPIFVWVYARRRGRQIAVFNVARAVTTRLPLRLLNVMCLGLAAGQWLCFLAPYRLLRRVPALAPLAERVPFTLYARYPFRVLHADWFDLLSPALTEFCRADEVEGWYKAAGLERIDIRPDWQGRALGSAPQALPERT